MLKVPRVRVRVWDNHNPNTNSNPDLDPDPDPDSDPDPDQDRKRTRIQTWALTLTLTLTLTPTLAWPYPYYIMGSFSTALAAKELTIFRTHACHAQTHRHLATLHGVEALLNIHYLDRLLMTVKWQPWVGCVCRATFATQRPSWVRRWVGPAPDSASETWSNIWAVYAPGLSPAPVTQ